MRIRIGTRASRLARAQTDLVAGELTRLGVQVEIVAMHTEGDRRREPLPEIGGKGLFTAALEARLRDGAIDLAVHSLKDLPTELPSETALAAVLPRGPVADALVTADGCCLADLPTGARVGTSSPRRRALLARARPDLVVVDLRGNLDTRLRQVGTAFDALVVAEAGLVRLGRADVPHVTLPPEQFVPAPGQGAIAVEARQDLPEEVRTALARLDDPPTRAAVEVERRFLAALGGGCATPVGAYAEVVAEGRFRLTAFRAGADGHHGRIERLEGDVSVAEHLAGRFRDGREW